MLKTPFRTLISKFSLLLWLAILLSATVPVLATQQHRASSGLPATGPQQQIVQQEPTVEFQSASDSVSESGGSVSVTVVLSEIYSETVSVDYAATGGTATAGDDFSPESGMVQIPDGQLSNTFMVNIVDDDIDEGTDETITLTLSNPISATVGAQGSTTLTITDDDDATVKFASPTTPSVNEGEGTIDVMVELSNESASSVSVEYATNDVTATAGEDYSDTSGVLPIPAGELTGTISIPILNDSLHEGNETFTVSLTDSSGASVVSPSLVTVTITDGDPPPTVQFSNSTYNVAEDGGPATITVTLSAPAGSDVTVTATSTGSGTATAGSDYAAVNQVVTIPAGEPEATFNVAINNDTLNEDNETVGLSLSNPSVNATLGTPASATLTITDNDPLPTVRFSSESYPVGEGDGTRQITVQLNTASGRTVTVDYATGGGSATAGSDYTTTNGTLTFTPGDTVETFDVPITNDNVFEPTETINLTLTSPGNAAPGAFMSATIFIQDNDPTPSARFFGAPYDVNEGDVSATITVVLSNPAQGLVSVDYATSDGTATAGADYTARNNTLTFPSGVITRTFTVPINDDLIDENQETVNLALSNPQGVQLGIPSNSVLTIFDNDGATEVRFASATYSVTESVVTATIGVVRSGLSAFPVSVDYETTGGGSATPGQDYAPTAGTLNFGSNETSKSFEVTIHPDQINEPDETVNLRLLNPVLASLGDPQTAVLTIHDSNETPAVQFSQSTYTVDESLLTANITVTLNVATAQDVTVHYATQEGSATLGQDYGDTGGTLVIPAGQTVGTFALTLLPDQLDEPDETVLLTLSGADGAELGERTNATLVIVDNDPTPTISFSLSSLTVGETSGTADLPVRLSAASGRTITVDYTTVNGSAIAGSDYVARSGTLTFSPGETTKIINVPIIESLAGEPNETFVVELSAPANAALSTPDTVTVTIVDGELILFSGFFPVGFFNYAIGEPNNGCSQAYEIVPSYTYNFLPDDKYDYYRFTLEETAHVIIEVTNFTPIKGQAALYKSTGEPCNSKWEDLANNATPGTDKTIDAGIQTPGEYLIIVVNDGEPTNSQPYYLRLRLESE